MKGITWLLPIVAIFMPTIPQTTVWHGQIFFFFFTYDILESCSNSVFNGFSARQLN